MKPILLLLLAALTAQAATFTGKEVGVSDDDTITVLAAGNKQFRIRLLAIDTPESGQAFGDKAKQALSKKVFGQFVQVHWTEQDKFKRVLGNITIGQRWINYEMEAEGWAWHYKQYDKDKRFAVAEVKAKAARRGLWGGQNPVAPWEWRRQKKGGNRASDQAAYKAFTAHTSDTCGYCVHCEDGGEVSHG